MQVVDVSATMLLKFQQSTVEFFKVLSFSSSSEWWIFWLRDRDRYTVLTVQKAVLIAQVQFLDWLGHPLLFNDRCLVLQSRKLWMFHSCSSWTRLRYARYCTTLKPVEFLQVQFLDRLRYARCCTTLKPVEIPQVQSMDRWSYARCCTQTAENCGFSAGAVLEQVVPCPLL